MKISELRARERYGEMLEPTIRSAERISAELHWDADTPQSCQWFLHPFFNVYTTGSLCPSGRRFLYEQYAHSPHCLRQMPQKCLTALLATDAVFKRTQRPAFCAAASAPGFLMWMPGNHRFRLFNFRDRTVRIFPKSGFSTDGILCEIAFRKTYAGQYSWLLPLIRESERMAAWEEPLVKMQAVNRMGNGIRYRQACQNAREALSQLHAIGARRIPPTEFLRIKRAEFNAAAQNLTARFGGVDLTPVRALWKKAEDIILGMDAVCVAASHGDFQPGNILVPYDAGLPAQIALIDWEDQAKRAAVYDEITFMMHSRSPKGLSARIGAFLRAPQYFGDMTQTQAVALWFVEEWIWLCTSSARPGISSVPHGLETHFRELPRLKF